MPLPDLSSLAIPAVLLLISFLGYSSQLFLLPYLEPGPLEFSQAVSFNVLLALLLISYLRSCYTDPGVIKKGWDDSKVKEDKDAHTIKEQQGARKRLCRKCQMVKPPRAHHCKICKRCIPKMDHHCPWTANCVSHRTFPHFMRFLFYAVVAMTYLESFLYVRGKVIWDNRHWPSYLGPSISQLIHLFLLIGANSLTLFALAILLVRNIWCLAVNTTTIEGWEIERHEALVRRSRVLGGYLKGPNGELMRITKQEFPYDIGIWANFKQGMNTANVLGWFWPLSATPTLESGLKFEENGFEDPSLSWPPPDPDRIPYTKSEQQEETAFLHQDMDDNQSRIAAFKQRQQADLQRRRPFHRRFGPDGVEDDDEVATDDENSPEDDGEEGWRNSEGERLRDFGVDEDVEFYDEDDLPLAELIKLRKQQR